MPVETIALSALGIDLRSRVVDTTTVAASPSAATETIIGTLTIPGFSAIAVQQAIYLTGWAALTVGTNGASVQLRIRKTNVSGTAIADTGALTGGVAATDLVAFSLDGSEATPGVGVYVLTAEIGSATAASTVSALSLRAIIV